MIFLCYPSLMSSLGIILRYKGSISCIGKTAASVYRSFSSMLMRDATQTTPLAHEWIFSIFQPK